MRTIERGRPMVLGLRDRQRGSWILSIVCVGPRWSSNPYDWMSTFPLRRTVTCAHAYARSVSGFVVVSVGAASNGEPPDPTMICHACPPVALRGCETL